MPPGKGRQMQSEDDQFNGRPRRGDQSNEGYNQTHLNSGRMGASNESGGAITPTNIGGKSSELQL